MASEEIVWNIINQQFCSYKVKLSSKTQTFCRNEYSVNGLCLRGSCPLANFKYATVRSDPAKGVCLYIKTPERAHLPKDLWEVIKLSLSYKQALEQIDTQLQFFPKHLVHKCKQRLTRIFQVNIRTKKIAAEERRLGEKLVPKLKPKVKHREEARERKAEMAAKLERTIERELIERLRQGIYGDQPLNVSEEIWQKVLKGLEKQGEATRDKDMDRGIEEEDEEEPENAEGEVGVVEYISDFEESDSDANLNDIEDWLESDDDEDHEEDEDDEDVSRRKSKTGDKRKRGRVVRMAKKRKEMELEGVEEPQKLLAI